MQHELLGIAEGCGVGRAHELYLFGERYAFLEGGDGIGSENLLVEGNHRTPHLLKGDLDLLEDDSKMVRALRVEKRGLRAANNA